jgi:sugar/nucleoside kinase (ribokinase family)
MSAVGGNALYSAVGARFCTTRVSMAAVVGTDWPASSLVKLTRSQIDCRHVKSQPHESLRAWIIYEDNGKRRYLLRNPEVVPHTPNPLGPAMTLEETNAYAEAATKVHLRNCPSPQQVLDELNTFDAVHLCPMPRSTLHAWLSTLTKYPEILVSLDVPPFGAQSDDTEAQLDALLSKVDIFMPSEAEAHSIQPDFSPQDFCPRMAQKGPKLVLLKMGGKGLWLYDRKTERLRHFPAFPTHVVDPTGAGDAFCGAFVAHYSASGNPSEAAIFAVAASSVLVESFGAIPSLAISPAKMKQRLDKFIEIINT